jgi:hypothetical protein
MRRKLMAFWKRIEQGKHLLYLDRCEDVVFIHGWELVKKRTPRNPTIDDIERTYFVDGLGLREDNLAFVNTRLRAIGEPILDFPPTWSNDYTSGIRGADKARERCLIRDAGVSVKTLDYARAECAMLRPGEVSDSRSMCEPISTRPSAARALCLEDGAAVKVRHTRELEQMRVRHAAELAAAEIRDRKNLARAIQDRISLADPAVLAEIAKRLELG